MPRESEISHKIAILATGDEICLGDIYNSNSQEIAQRLVAAGMHVRLHASAPDTIHEIEQVLRFLLSTHQAIIITGGLGPTSDDLTRFALSKVIDQPLQFDATTWSDICERLQKFGYPTPPESNRQQALFPEGAAIIPNPHGTAAGCIVQFQQQIIFMLPGPPSECLPMLDNSVLPTLKDAGFSQSQYHQSWLLFGVSEGKIAEELDAIAKPFACITGYRLFYPYLEFKIHSQNEADFLKLLPLIEKAIQPYLLGDGKQTASELLREKIMQLTMPLSLVDNATGGALEATLKTPKTYAKLHFSTPKTFAPQITINGLEEFWQGKIDKQVTHLEIEFSDNKQHSIRTSIPFRGKRVINYAVEFICYQIARFIQNV